MRLIDADALIAQMETNIKQADDPIAKMLICAAIADVKFALARIPITIIEPELTGKWIYVTDGYVDYFRCDRCGKPVFADTPYCPNCGARMQESDKTN